jgi:hypothetical protein
MWLTSFFTRDGDTRDLLADSFDGRDRNPAGYEQSIDPPGTEELEALKESSFEISLELAVESASTVAVAVESADALVTAKGVGDERKPGPSGSGDGVPNYARWELKFMADGLQQYAEQLDFYQIELACIGGREEIDYANHLSSSPTMRSASPQEENKLHRLHFIWREDGPLKRYDEQLLNRAGVRTAGRLILRFIPKELERELLEKEFEYAKRAGRSVPEIEKTVFESRAAGKGAEFAVIHQSYRINN